METIVRSATIPAAPEIVFPFLAQPEYLPRILPGSAEVDDIQRVGLHDWHCHWNRRLLNVHFDGVAAARVDAQAHRVTIKTTGGLLSMVAWVLDVVEGETRATLKAECTVPTPLLHKHSADSVREALAADVEQMLVNLAALAESAPKRSSAQRG